MYIFIYFTLIVFKEYDQKKTKKQKQKNKTKQNKTKTKQNKKTKEKKSQKMQNWESGTILHRLVLKPRSSGQALGGVQGAELPEVPRFKPY